MIELRRKLTIKEGIPLAIGSIMGSGILFLPSLTTAISGKSVIYTWLIATVLCILMLFIFVDMVNKVPNESGLEGFIALGFGERFSACIPILFLGTVSMGMPLSAYIAAGFLKTLFFNNSNVQLVGCITIIAIGIIVNLCGVRLSTVFQLLVSLSLFVLGAIFWGLSAHAALPNYPSLFTTFSLEQIIPGVVVTIWAFAGLENLTFMAGEFKNPERDFKISALVGLLSCAIIYILLSANYAALVSSDHVNSLLGLYQLTEFINPVFHSNILVAFFSFLAVQLSFNSWIWGMSRLIYSSAKKGKFPKLFFSLNTNQIPSRAILLLAFLFSISTFVFITYPNLIETALVLVSTNFLFIYILFLSSYIKYKGLSYYTVIASLILIGLVVALASSKYLIIYPVFLSIGAILFAKPKQLKNIIPHTNELTEAI